MLAIYIIGFTINWVIFAVILSLHDSAVGFEVIALTFLVGVIWPIIDAGMVVSLICKLVLDANEERIKSKLKQDQQGQSRRTGT